MTAKVRLDRKARTAVIAAVVLILAGPLLVVTKLTIARAGGGSEQVFHPADDDLVSLPDGSTMLVKRSEGRRIADWLKLDTTGEETFEVGNSNFAPGSATPTPDGWEHLAQFAHMLNASPSVRAVILYSAYHGNPKTVQLEHMRADRIRDELVNQSVDAQQVAVAPQGFEAGHNAAADEGLEVVLTNKG
jgi:outer membrane protein OmpA-like peptidoglycan-associated protein